METNYDTREDSFEDYFEEDEMEDEEQTSPPLEEIIELFERKYLKK